MKHLLVQTSPVPPTLEQLKEAFRGIKGMTAADATKISFQAFGVLVRNLSEEDAQALARSLQAQGAGAAAVTDAEVPFLPEPKFTRRVELQPEALLIHDAIGRPVPVPWGQVALLAAGMVPRMNLVAYKTEDVKVSVTLAGHRRQEVVTQTDHKLDTTGQLVLDIVLTGGRMRFQIESKEFLYKYTIDRPELTPNERFGELVRMLLAQAPQALLNRGATQLRDGAPLPLAYTSKAAFSDESAWLLWYAAGQQHVRQP